jgi:hypothetical protein
MAFAFSTVGAQAAAAISPPRSRKLEPEISKFIEK